MTIILLIMIATAVIAAYLDRKATKELNQFRNLLNNHDA